MIRQLQLRAPRLHFELLEERRLLAFSVARADVFGIAGLKLVTDFDQAVDASTVQAADLLIDGSVAASSATMIDADTVEFALPTLAAGAHSVAIASGLIRDTQGTALTAFSKSFSVAAGAQLAIKHNPRLQLGNAPLVGYAGSNLDRVDVLWQTIPGGSGTQDSFLVEYRPTGSNGAWQAATLNPSIVTGVENRVVWSASIAGLNWNSDYSYRVQHRRADVVMGQYGSSFHTRLAPSDESSFTFAAYGDSASGAATGFRQVQARINQNNPAFSVLLGDNVYTNGTHPELDSRFDPLVNPEAAAWTAGHIDYLAMGNHDIGTSSGLPSEQDFSVPIPVAGVTAPAAPPSTERPEHNYSWDYGDVHFVTFDTNSYNDSARLNNLLNWVVADLNASTAHWKIVYGHHPLAGVPDQSVTPSGNYYQQVVSRLKTAGADLFMVGHSHTYSWTYPLTGQAGGIATYADHGQDDLFYAGEGLTQLVSGLGGASINSGSYSQFPFVAEGFTSNTAVPARLGYSQVQVTPDQLTVSYVAADNGAVIDSFRISKTVAPQTATFQQGASGYTGAVDTYLHQNAPSTSNASSTSLNVDGDDPAGTGLDVEALLRFDNLFGSGAGQIPVNATLQSATLQLQVTNAGNSVNLHRVLANWTATDTWNSLSSGIQADGIDALTTADTSSGSVAIGLLSLDVLTSLKAWQASPATNRGWAFLSTGTDGIDFNSSEGTIRPKLIVNYLPAQTANRPPVANNDSAASNEDTPVIVSVLTNDSDPDNDSLTVTSVGAASHGVPVMNANGTVTFTPAANYFGSDSFAYTISDGKGGTASGTVNVTVVGVNDAPVATNDTATTITTTPVTINVLSNDSDVEGASLSVVIAASPANGAITVNANGTISYTANASFSGVDSFTYRASDGVASSNLATVTVTVTAGAKFFVVDSSSDRTYRYQANGASVSNSALATGNTNSRGIASNADGSRLWVLDNNRTVYVYDAALTLLGSWSAGSLNTPTGIAVAGTNVWIVDSGNDRAYLYSGASSRLSGSLSPTRSFALSSSNSNPQDLATDGTTMWVTQSGTTDRVFVYQASNGASLGNWIISSANTSPVGITLDPTGASNDLWIVDSSTDRIYAYSNGRARRSGSQSASVSYALNSGNGSAQGIADPNVLTSIATSIMHGESRSRVMTPITVVAHSKAVLREAGALSLEPSLPFATPANQYSHPRELQLLSTVSAKSMPSNLADFKRRAVFKKAAIEHSAALDELYHQLGINDIAHVTVSLPPRRNV